MGFYCWARGICVGWLFEVLRLLTGRTQTLKDLANHQGEITPQAIQSRFHLDDKILYNHCPCSEIASCLRDWMVFSAYHLCRDPVAVVTSHGLRQRERIRAIQTN